MEAQEDRDQKAEQEKSARAIKPPGTARGSGNVDTAQRDCGGEVGGRGFVDGDTAESLRLLAWWRTELEAMYAGKVKHPVFVALEGTAHKHELPIQLFSDLISAF